MHAPLSPRHSNPPRRSLPRRQPAHAPHLFLICFYPIDSLDDHEEIVGCVLRPDRLVNFIFLFFGGCHLCTPPPYTVPHLSLLRLGESFSVQSALPQTVVVVS